MNGEQFWGIPVPVRNSPVTYNLEGKCLHVTQCALKNGKKDDLVVLEVSTETLGNRTLVLASLSASHPQAVLDATFFESDGSVTFHARGGKKASIHLTGVVVSAGADNEGDDEYEEEEEEEYITSQMTNGDDLDDDDDDDDEEEEEDDNESEEEPPAPSPRTKKKKRKKRSSSDDVSNETFVASSTTPKSSKKKKKRSNSANEDDLRPSTPFVKRKSGLKVAVMEQGRGSKLTPGQKVKLNYKGFLSKDNSCFDRSQKGSPLVFRAGHGRVIKGIDEGVMGMKVGEKRILVIPPNLAYGTKGAGDVVPPNATLKFEVERAG